MNNHEIRQKIEQYKFYHIIQLTDQIATPGNPVHLSTQNMVLEAIRKIDLRGKRVLDIGCRDGLFAFEAEKRGSAEVIGIDNDLSKPAVEFLIPFLKSGVKMFEMNLFDLRPDTFGHFDVVIFAGVLYHLRYPFWALRTIRDVLNNNGKLILETAIWSDKSHRALLYCPVEESPYEPTSCAFFNEKGLCTTLRSFGFEVEAIQYLSQRESLKGLLRYVGQVRKKLRKRIKEAFVKADIDRGVFTCSFSCDAVNQQLAQYWEKTHTIHTQIGG